MLEMDKWEEAKVHMADVSKLRWMCGVTRNDRTEMSKEKETYR